MESISLNDFNRLQKDIWEQRKRVDQLTEDARRESAKLQAMKYKLLAYMEASGQEKVHTPGLGTLFVRKDFSVRVPKGDDKKIFFDFLKERNELDALMTVNSQTLNSWFRSAMEEAIERGCSGFTPPGLGEPTLTKSIGFRKT